MWHNTSYETLYDDLMKLCTEHDAFYFVDHVYNGHTYRVFAYRLASYSEFLLPGALECRGHTFFLQEGKQPVLVSAVMQKFFNVGENPYTMNLDWSKVVRVDDKLDGSLISTVRLPNGEYILKSKTSLSSEQARAATRLLGTEKYWEFAKVVGSYVSMGCTVNMEYMAPDNQIVIGYSEPTLKVLNIRHNQTGQYVDFTDEFNIAGSDSFVCPSIPFEELSQSHIDGYYELTGIEGYVLTFSDGLKAKVKTKWYSNLHLQKEQITNPRRLFESVINETSDDLKVLFLADPIAVQRIEDMEVKGRELYNRLHKKVEEFYVENRELDRKSYAIKANLELSSHKIFSQAMNLYLGKDIGLKEFLIKNYKNFGIVDTTADD